MKCPKCQQENPSDTRFCGHCGLQLPSSEKEKIIYSQTETFQAPIKELTAGSTFARRYQVIEELGKGGMGKVYKVLDTEIKERVALKLLKPEIASDEQTIERFRNELKFARKVAHRNVCRMYDLGQAEGSYFITMEYVAGEDLKSLIRRMGPFTIEKAISIAEQVAEGLAEAHRLGVVHRDLKPQNIMVDKEGNARVMDFGVARSLKAKGITGEGVMIGTPEYMSPEQVEGKDADQRSDIYALGVILFEMLTGRVPFAGDTPLSVAVKHKTEPPQNPAVINPQIPENLSRLILKCLEKDKAKRYQSAEDALSELKKIKAGGTTASGLYAPTMIAKKKPRSVVLAISAIALVVIAVAAFFAVKNLSLNVNPKRIAVAVLENKTGDSSLDSIGSIASDWITQGISQTGLVEVVPSMAVQESSRLVGSRTGGIETLSQLRALAKETGAGTIISGSYYLQGENLQFQTRITDARKRKLLVAIPPVSGKRASPMDVIGVLREHVMGAMAVKFDPRFAGNPISRPPLFEAYKEFFIGQEFFGKDYPQAMIHFTRAAEIDPEYMMPKLWMAVGYGNIGHYEKEDEILQVINKSREQLSPFDTHVLDWVMADLRGNKEEALKHAELAEKLAPKQVTINYVVGYSELGLNRPRNTVKTYAKLSARELEPYFSKGPTTGSSWRFNVLAEAYHLLAEYKKELKVAQEGQKYSPDYLPLIADEARALAALGRISEVHKVIEKSLSISSKRGTPGEVMSEAARELRAHGFPDEARKIATQEVEWYKNRQSEEAATEDTRYGLAGALYDAERWDEAKKLFEELSREKPENIDYKGCLGTVAARQGNREDALRISEELKNINQPYLFGNHTYWRACVASLLGDKELAVSLLRESFAQGRDYGVYLHRDPDLEPLRDYPPFQELIKPKS